MKIPIEKEEDIYKVSVRDKEEEDIRFSLTEEEEIKMYRS